MALLRSTPSRRKPEAILRTVQPSDLDAVRRVLQVAFEDENRRMGLRVTRLPSIRDELLAFYLDRAPHASFAAEGKGGLFGFCLACVWGSVAWLGPIAVLPPAQGRHLGRRLIAASTEALRAAGVRTLGVETMPRSYRNLQLYTKLGMTFGPMTFDLSRYWERQAPFSSSGRGGEVDLRVQIAGPDASGEQRERMLREVRGLSAAAAEGLDYRIEAAMTLQHRIGRVAVAHDASDRAVGFAVVHTEPYAREEAPGTARINTLVLVPSSAVGVHDLFGAFARFLLSRLDGEGFNAAIFRVAADQPMALNALQDMGFLITHSDVRLTYRDLPVADRPGVVHLSKWE